MKILTVRQLIDLLKEYDDEILVLSDKKDSFAGVVNLTKFHHPLKDRDYVLIRSKNNYD